MAAFLRQVVRYLATGVTSLLVDVGGLYVLHAHLSVPVALAAALSFLASFAVNFTLSQRWTFRVRQRTGAQLVRFTLLVIANTIFIAVSVGLLAAWGLHYLVAKLLVTAVAVTVNFFLMRGWVFASEAPCDRSVAPSAPSRPPSNSRTAAPPD